MKEEKQVSCVGTFWCKLECEDTDFSVQLNEKPISSKGLPLVGHGSKLEDTTNGVVS